MNGIVKLQKNEVHRASHLFNDIPFGWDVIYQASLEYGFILADSPVNPEVALSFMGGCMIYGGDAGSSEARELIRSMKYQPVVLAYPPAWADLLKNEFADEVKIIPRYHLPFSSLDKQILYSLDLSPGNEFELVKIDEPLAEKLKDELGEEYHLHHYSSLSDFASRGCGFCITRGNEICAAAAAFLRSGDRIQIQVNTKNNYRRQGMATKVSARLLRYCLENGINADWDAANINSRDLARKLGYADCRTYDVISILPDGV